MSSASGSRQGYAGSAFSNIVGALPSRVSTGYGWKQESSSLTSSNFTPQASEFSGRYGGGHKHVSLPSSIVSTGASKFSTEYGGRQDHTRLAASYSIVKVESSEFSRVYGGREENAGLPTSIVGGQATKISREYGGRQDNAGLTYSMGRVAQPSGRPKSENVDDQHGKRRLTSSTATQLASHSHVNVPSSARIDHYDLPNNTRPDQNESAISVMEDFFYNIGFSGYS